MNLPDAIRAALADPVMLLIRREIWIPEAPGLEVGDVQFLSLEDGRAVPYLFCRDDILADDWVVEK